ncbi:hypothetical protein [Escherichia albertii]|uniref:hypothetical protein n=1 Tax=Escherichia albertii TaxID=208962 RepID=UPI00235F8C42|nr:hypothetical protein [Escherichia albertii]WDC22085.1 hypothetical protein PS041_09035 [Escherichia albertii]
MTSLKTSIKTITYLSDIGCLEIQGASLGGVQDVRETGSKAVDTIINSNGVQEIHDGGEALTTHIYGGAQYIDGGIADDTYIHSGTQNIDRGGKATNTYIYNGKQIVREREGRQ